MTKYRPDIFYLCGENLPALFPLFSFGGEVGPEGSSPLYKTYPRANSLVNEGHRNINL